MTSPNIKNLIKKKIVVTLLGLTLLGCQHEEPQEVSIEEPKIIKHEAAKEPIDAIVEIISPLKELDENASKLNLPNRSPKSNKVPKPLTYRIAD